MEKNKHTMSIVLATAVLLLLVIGTLAVVSLKPAPPQAAVTQVVVTPSVSPISANNTTTGETYSLLGTNGFKSFSFTAPSGWLYKDGSAKHHALWVTLTKGKSVILINQEPTAGEQCVYPDDTSPSAEMIKADNDNFERFGNYSFIKTLTGENIKVAPQRDSVQQMYACQLGGGIDPRRYGVLTAIGKITLLDPELNKDKSADFLKLLESVSITTIH